MSPTGPSAFDQAREAAAHLAEQTGQAAYVALVVLGSGWGPAVESWGEPVLRLRASDVPHFRAPVAEGHRGELLVFDLGGRAVLVQSGRTHLYEGHGPRPVVHGVRTAAALGVRLVLLTNANGSLRPDWEIGQPVLISDHLNLTATSPVEGATFVDLTDAWSPRLRSIARRLDAGLTEGVYAQLVGPHYNTAAEAEWMRRVGGDMVGMSTVPEAIAARECSMEVVGFSTVTAIEGGGDVTDPREVVRAAESTAARLGPLLAALLTEGITEGARG
ncbi:purine-nucleoside phosphorylase [Nocardioides bigeumensis]|uniref:Purine nucleoside phosphorylase n=1 Tax=Nocardioides bigeumensis TaxID=433657 RepID=A0ABN2YU35_9ACTN